MTDMSSIRGIAQSALTAAQADFASALAGGDPTWTFLGTNLRVDRRRGIAATSDEPRDWRDDSIDESVALGRLFLRLFVGPDRYFQAGEFAPYLAAVCLDKSAISETHTALFGNLSVAEPFFHPERERAIWLATALELAAGRDKTNVFEMLPGLRSETDPVVRTVEDDPGRWLRLEASLLGRAIPSSVSELEAAITDRDIGEAIERYRDDLDSFVDAHLLSVVAELLTTPWIPGFRS